MPFNINNFSAVIANNGKIARSSHFEMTIAPPRLLRIDGTAASVIDLGSVQRSLEQAKRKDKFNKLPWGLDNIIPTAKRVYNSLSNENGLTFRIDSAEFPGRSILNIPYTDYGLPRKMAIGSNVVESSFSVICSEDLRERILFETWQDMIAGTYREPNAIREKGEDRYGIGYYSDYISDAAVITQFNESGIPTYRCTLKECYPQLVSPLSLSWAADEIHRMTVVMTYRHFQDESLPITERQQTIDKGISLQQIISLGAQAGATIKGLIRK